MGEIQQLLNYWIFILMLFFQMPETQSCKQSPFHISEVSDEKSKALILVVNLFKAALKQSTIY